MGEQLDRCPDCGSGDFSDCNGVMECYTCDMERTKREKTALKLIEDMLEDILDRSVESIRQTGNFPEPCRESISSVVIERAKKFIVEGK